MEDGKGMAMGKGPAPSSTDVDAEIMKVNAEIDAVEEEITKVNAKIDAVEEEIKTVAAKIESTGSDPIMQTLLFQKEHYLRQEEHYLRRKKHDLRQEKSDLRKKELLLLQQRAHVHTGAPMPARAPILPSERFNFPCRPHQFALNDREQI